MPRSSFVSFRSREINFFSTKLDSAKSNFLNISFLAKLDNRLQSGIIITTSLDMSRQHSG